MWSGFFQLNFLGRLIRYSDELKYGFSVAKHTKNMANKAENDLLNLCQFVFSAVDAEAEVVINGGAAEAISPDFISDITLTMRE